MHYRGVCSLLSIERKGLSTRATVAMSRHQ
jgi:hypothetical protein